LWQKAYTLLKTAYDKKQRQPSVIEQIKNLEDKLKLPLMQRIPEKRQALEQPQGMIRPTQ